MTVERVDVREGRAHVIVVGRYSADGPWEATDSRTGEFGRGATPAEAVANIGSTVEPWETRTLGDLVATAAALVGLEWEQMIGSSLSAGIVARRRLAWWMLRRLMPVERLAPTGTDITSVCGKNSHGNIYSACLMIENALDKATKDEFRRAWHAAIRCRIAPKRADREPWFVAALTAIAPERVSSFSIAM